MAPKSSSQPGELTACAHIDQSSIPLCCRQSINTEAFFRNTLLSTKVNRVSISSGLQVDRWSPDNVGMNGLILSRTLRIRDIREIKKSKSSVRGTGDERRAERRNQNPLHARTSTCQFGTDGKG